MRISLVILSLVGAVMSGDGYLKFDLQKQKGAHLRKRQNDANPNGLKRPLTAKDDLSSYYVNLTIGTPPQPLALQLDTGSADLLMTNSNVTSCSQPGQCMWGTFNPSGSSTFELVQAGTFKNSYADGSGYVGDYFTDTVFFGDIRIDNFTMGIANQLIDAAQYANDGTGVIGVNYPAGTEFNNVLSGAAPETAISAMTKSGIISRQAFSVFLDSGSSRKGSIIFGGIDSSLYTGDLVAVPIEPKPNEYGNYSALQVALTGISVTDASGTHQLTDSNFGVLATLDTGTSSQNLPFFVADQIFQGLGVTHEGEGGVIPCSRAQANVSITYHFGGEGGPSITIPLSDLITDPWSQYGNGESMCSIAMTDHTTYEEVILGDSFMRSGYFVFDLENNLVAIAQAATSSVGEGSVTVLSSGTDIPGCTSTNAFTLNSDQLTQSSGYDTPTNTVTSDSAATISAPATPTFDLGTVATQSTAPNSTDNISSSSSASASSASSQGGAASMPAMTEAASLGKVGVVVAAALVGLL